MTLGRSMLATLSSACDAWVSTLLRNSQVRRSVERYAET